MTNFVEYLLVFMVGFLRLDLISADQCQKTNTDLLAQVQWFAIRVIRY